MEDLAYNSGLEEMDKPITSIKATDYEIDTTNDMLTADKCQHGKYVSIEDCEYGCIYVVDGVITKYA